MGTEIAIPDSLIKVITVVRHTVVQLQEVVGVTVNLITWGGCQTDEQRVEITEDCAISAEDTPMGFVDDVRRTKNTFSDKNLEIVEQSDLDGMLRTLPDCRGVLLAGQLATQVFTSHFAIKTIPEMGQYTTFTFEGRELRLYCMPSSSRAYPMAVEKKSEFYRIMFNDILVRIFLKIKSQSSVLPVPLAVAKRPL